MMEAGLISSRPMCRYSPSLLVLNAAHVQRKGGSVLAK